MEVRNEGFHQLEPLPIVNINESLTDSKLNLKKNKTKTKTNKKV